MLGAPSSTARIGLDEVRKGHAKLDLGVDQRCQLDLGPWELVEVHLSESLFAAPRLVGTDRGLTDERQRILRTPGRSVEVWNTHAERSNEMPRVRSARSRREPPKHLMCPTRGVDDQRPDRLRPVRWVLGSKSRHKASSLRGRSASCPKRLEDAPCQVGAGRQQGEVGMGHLEVDNHVRFVRPLLRVRDAGSTVRRQVAGFGHWLPVGVRGVEERTSSRIGAHESALDN